MKLDFNYILTNKEIISKNDILTINYITATGKGCFNVLMPAKFPATAHDMNIFIDMFYKTEAPETTARTLYDYLTKCVEALKDFRELAKKVNEPANVAQVTNEIKRYNANLEKLCKAFNFEVSEDPEAVKMHKVEVVKQGTKNGKKFVENRTGKKFVKYGHIFHVYKEPKGDSYIIIPCCGIAALAYNGPITEAPEHITPDLIAKMDKLNFKKMNDDLLEVLEGAENIILNDDINIIYNDEIKAPEAPEAIQEPTKAPEDPEKIEIVNDETIVNVKIVTYKDKTYSITCDCANNYIISCGCDYVIKSDNSIECNPGILNDTLQELIDVYKLVKSRDALPVYYEPEATEAPEVSEVAENKPQRPFYIALLYYGLIPDNTGHATRHHNARKAHKGILYPATLYKGITSQYRRPQGHIIPYTSRYNPGYNKLVNLWTVDALRAGIIRRQAMPALMYHDTC